MGSTDSAHVRDSVAKVRLPGYKAEYFKVSDVMEWEPLPG